MKTRKTSLFAVLFLVLSAFNFSPSVTKPFETVVKAQSATDPAEIIFATTSTNSLISFSTSAPTSLLSNVAISGLADGERFVGIDFRPATGQLYGVTTASRMYIISPGTGAASAVGTAAFTPAANGGNFGFDFNPVPDRIRFVSDSEQNLRLNPNTGGIAGTDTNLVFAQGDPNAGANPSISGVAYTNNFAGTPQTTLYGIDTGLDALVRQGDFTGAPISPNSGQLFTAGPLGVNATGRVGFDIANADGRGFATLNVDGDPGSSLYQINLINGRASFFGFVGNQVVVESMSIAPHPRVFGLTENNALVTFDGTNPGPVLSRVQIFGTQAGEAILGIDFRPATGVLYALGSSNRIYTIDTRTGEAKAVGTAAFTPALAGTSFGFDFNPVPDRIRVTSNTGQNLRLNPDTGAVAATDTALAFAAADRNAGVTPSVVGSAYTNSVNLATTTTLYNIDFNLDSLLTQNPPNDGVLNTIGRLGVNATSAVGFDISSIDGSALASITPEGAAFTNLYRVSLVSGQATLVGRIGDRIRDVAIDLNQARLAVNQSADKTSIKAGETLTLTITVNNFGPDVATNVTVRNPFSAILVSVDSATANQGTATTATADNVTTVTGNLGSIPAGGSATITIMLKANAGAVGQINNTVTVLTGSGDINRGSNTSVLILNITQ